MIIFISEKNEFDTKCWNLTTCTYVPIWIDTHTYSQRHILTFSVILNRYFSNSLLHYPSLNTSVSLCLSLSFSLSLSLSLFIPLSLLLLSLPFHSTQLQTLTQKRNPHTEMKLKKTGDLSYTMIPYIRYNKSAKFWGQ